MKLQNLLLVVATALADPVQAGLAEQPSLQSSLYRTTQIPCPVAVGPEEIDGKTTICGILTVPENYTQPNGRKVEITYTIFKSKSLAPQHDPLLVLHGGPGSSDITNLSVVPRFYEPQRQTRDVILFDQRGSRFSGDLACSPTFIGLDTLAKDSNIQWRNQYAEFTKKFAASLEKDLSNLAEILSYYKVCSQLLQAHGFDLNQYNTTNNATDAINLATALGYQKVNLYGISYGTYLALRIMRDYPQRLRSVVLDSTIPPQVKKYVDVPRDLEVVMLNLIEDCQKDTACNAAYPNLKARTIALLKTLAKKPILIAGTDKAVSVADFAALVESVNFDLDARKAAYIPLIVSELERGITTTYTGVVSGKIFLTPPTKPIPIGRSEQLLAKADELREQARKLLTETANLAEANRPSQKWLQQVLTMIETLPEKERPKARANLYGVGFQTQKPRDRSVLIASIAEIFPENKRQPLIQPLQTMSNTEMRHVYESIGTIFRSVLKIDSDEAEGVFRSFDCQDLVPSSDQAQTNATFKALEMPSLGVTRALGARQAYAICQIWSVKPAPQRDREIVKSSIPTLILQDRYDAQTPTTVGKQALAGLRNGTLIEFPNFGHGALVFSQCARDVGAAFVTNPTSSPNAACKEALKTKFVLPPTSSK
ncbi:alpha/beta fold hydrolase [Nostoc sp.]|uniref:alpha/beta fold hydrolase n=1 Tax=Nostoc sp. TaxID=1180 RepID=UPI002FFBD2A8